MRDELRTSALVLVEYQHEWLDPAGKLRHLMGDPIQFEGSLARSATALAAARAAGMAVVHMGLRFAPDYRELGGKGAARHGLRAAIPQAGTFSEDGPGHAFVMPFAPLPGEFAGSGRTGASIFAGSNLDIYLRNQGIRRIYLMGYALHVCVLASLCAGHDLGYEMVLLHDCCAAFSEAQRRLVVDDLAHHFGQCVSHDAFLSTLGTAPQAG